MDSKNYVRSECYVEDVAVTMSQIGPHVVRCSKPDYAINGLYIVNVGGTTYSNATLNCCKPVF